MEAGDEDSSPEMHFAPRGPAGGDHEAFLLLDSSGQILSWDEKLARLLGLKDRGSPAAPALSNAIMAAFPADQQPCDLISGQRISGYSISGQTRAGESGPAVRCLLTAPGGTLPATVRLLSMGSGWLFAIGVTDRPATVHSCPLSLLNELLACRADVARHMHDHAAQNLVGLSLTLASLRRNPETSSDPRFLRASELADRCSRDLRVLNSVLAPPLARGQDPDEDAAALTTGLEWYLANLRGDAGLEVRFKAIGIETAGSPDSGCRAIVCAVLQLWAQTAILQARSPATEIRLRGSSLFWILEILSGVPGDPAILAVLGSPLIRDSAGALGGVVERMKSHPGSGVRITIGTGLSDLIAGTS